MNFIFTLTPLLFAKRLLCPANISYHDSDHGNQAKTLPGKGFDVCSAGCA